MKRETYRLPRTLLALSLLATIPALGAPVSRAQELPLSPAAAPGGIVTQGTATVYVTPDIAHVTAGVRTQNPDSQKATRENALLCDAVIKAMRAQGVAEKDIRTEGYSLSPQYRYEQGKDPIITGYQVDNSVCVTVRKLGDVGHILDAAIKAGANVAGGVEFDLDDATADDARERALDQAVRQAAHKAIAMAQAASAGRIELVSVVEGAPATVYPRPVLFAARNAAPAEPTTPIAAGQQSVTESVTLRYSIDPREKPNY